MAIGLNEVDNLKPSKYLIKLMQDSIEGKKTYKKVENELYAYYKEYDPNDESIAQTEECDLVSLRIVKLLESGSFKFSPITLKSIHRELFKDLFNTSIYGDYNDLFKTHSLYFRNALVLSNYSDINRNIRPNFKYLESFFEKLLIDTNVELETMK